MTIGERVNKIALCRFNSLEAFVVELLCMSKDSMLNNVTLSPNTPI